MFTLPRSPYGTSKPMWRRVMVSGFGWLQVGSDEVYGLGRDECDRGEYGPMGPEKVVENHLRFVLSESYIRGTSFHATISLLPITCD